jgi:predicted Fe-Mo cluster-binding NifX family protein
LPAEIQIYNQIAEFFASRALLIEKGKKMRICIPTEDDQGLDSRLCGHFGSAPFLALADTDSGDVEIKPTPENHHEHGKCEPVKRIDANRTDAVVCRGMGKGAVSSFQQAGVEVLITSADTVRDAISQAGQGELRTLSVDDACGGHGGAHGHGNHCGNDSQ